MEQVPAGYPLGVRAIRDQVVVRQDPKQDRLPNGFFVPQTSERELQPDTGTVIAIGPKVVDVQVGDRIYFRRRPGSALEPDEREGLRNEEWRDIVILHEEEDVLLIEEQVTQATA